MKRYRTYVYLKHHYYDTVYAENEAQAIEHIKEQYGDETNEGAELEIIAVELLENSEK